MQFLFLRTSNPPYVSMYYTYRTTTGKAKPKLSGVASFTWQNASHNSGTVSPISCRRREVLAYLFSQESSYPCSWTDDTVGSKKRWRESFPNSVLFAFSIFFQRPNVTGLLTAHLFYSRGSVPLLVFTFVIVTREEKTDPMLPLFMGLEFQMTDCSDLGTQHFGHEQNNIQNCFCVCVLKCFGHHPHNVKAPLTFKSIPFWVH